MGCENTFFNHADNKNMDFFAQACHLQSYIHEHFIVVSDLPDSTFFFLSVDENL